MPYIVDTQIKNAGNYKKGGTIDYNTANKQAHQRAQQNVAASNNPSGAIKSSGGQTPLDNTGGGYSENYIDYDAILRAQQEAEAA